MAHKAGNYALTKILPLGMNYQINHIQALSLEGILAEDAKDYFYSATVSTANGLASVAGGQYSWATVKLYYSNFYLLRALLALSKICIFYHNSKPRLLKAYPNQNIQSPPAGGKKSTTHGLMINVAHAELGNAINASQQIDGMDPLEWTEEKRVEANYKVARFLEPNVPDYFLACKKYGIRKLTALYLNDNSMLYTFDPDHAMIAYNLFLWDYTRIQLINKGKFDFLTTDLQYLRSLFRDESGPLAHFNNLM